MPTDIWYFGRYVVKKGNEMTKKYKMLDWWIEATGHYAGIEEKIFVCSKNGDICVEPEDFEPQIKKLIESGKCAPGKPAPPKGSFSQLYYLVTCCFFDDNATEVAYEGEFEPVKSEPGKIY